MSIIALVQPNLKFFLITCTYMQHDYVQTYQHVFFIFCCKHIVCFAANIWLNDVRAMWFINHRS